MVSKAHITILIQRGFEALEMFEFKHQDTIGNKDLTKISHSIPAKAIDARSQTAYSWSIPMMAL